MASSKLFLDICALLLCVEMAASLRCAVCTNVTNPAACKTFSTCQVGERCFTTSFGIGSETTYNLGCESEVHCLDAASNVLVGRSISQQCSQCCAVDNCNNNLCSAGTPVVNEIGQCTDDPKYDCKQFSSVFNLCADIAHAKLVCRKWCGLCSLVDGSWSPWNTWSSCDVTCGVGHMTRSRYCTDPAPAHGGLPCSGSNTELQVCTKNPCPIHGGWSNWNSWSTCSKTCSIGLKSRHRQCNNPTPQLAGDHCFGDSSDYHACFDRSCADGGWASWSVWSDCSKGEKTRTRSCTSPIPSQFGKNCLGTDQEKERCGAVAFYMTHPSTALIDGRPVFTNLVTNTGGGYDVSSAKFTCPIAGMYMFTFGIMGIQGHIIYCFINKNGKAFARGYVSPLGANYFDSAATTSFIDLAVGDVVTVEGCSNWAYVDGNYSTFYSGALIET